MEFAALTDPDLDLELHLKRKVLLTYVCYCRHPNASADEINRVYHISVDSSEVERCLAFIRARIAEFKHVYTDLPTASVIDFLARTPSWLRYGSTVEMWSDINQVIQ